MVISMYFNDLLGGLFFGENDGLESLCFATFDVIVKDNVQSAILSEICFKDLKNEGEKKR